MKDTEDAGMGRQGDAETERYGDEFTVSPRLPVSASPRLLLT